MSEANPPYPTESLGRPRLNRSAADWGKTRRVRERLKKANDKTNGFYEETGPFYNKTGVYQGRPIIGRDRPINKGVYLGESEREAIVVDGKKDQELSAVYDELQIRLRNNYQRQGENYKQNLLSEVWRLVKEKIPYDENNVTRILQKLPEPDTKVYLSSFFGGGVCRHQALLAGYLLERLSKDGVVKGKVSVDRNYVDNLGGHAWARYKNSGGEVFILDPAQNYIGPLDQMSEKQYRWFYERPEDTNFVLRIAANFKRALRGQT